MEISARISCFKSDPASVTLKVWGEAEYYLDLKKEDKKQYKKKSTLSKP